MTQGRGDGMEWVSQYLVSYSPDGQMWSYVTESNNAARVSDVCMKTHPWVICYDNASGHWA